jgi:hypothetical protein
LSHTVCQSGILQDEKASGKNFRSVKVAEKTDGENIILRHAISHECDRSLGLDLSFVHYNEPNLVVKFESYFSINQ